MKFEPALMACFSVQQQTLDADIKEESERAQLHKVASSQNVKSNGASAAAAGAAANHGGEDPSAPLLPKQNKSPRPFCAGCCAIL